MNPFQTLRSLNAKMRFTHALCEAVEGQVSSISTYFVLLVFVTTFKFRAVCAASPWPVGAVPCPGAASVKGAGAAEYVCEAASR